METTKIKELIESITDTSAIYLLEALSSTSGFFTNDSKLLYIVKDTYNYSYEGIETDYLRLQTHVRISAIQNNPTFNNGFYNIIIYKESLTDSNINSFIQLCTINSYHANELDFKEFFYSLIDLFQLPVDQAFNNALGLYGELKFMQYAKKCRNIDISNSWHRRGSYSQYDFSNGERSIEIKTNFSDDSIVIIKHHQIFGEHPCYLAVIECEQYENGETIEELIESMYDDPLFFNGMNFNINLAKELKRVSVKDIKEIRFEIRDILIFDTNEINQFPNIPEAISELTYKLDVSEFNSLSKKNIDAIISTF